MLCVALCAHDLCDCALHTIYPHSSNNATNTVFRLGTAACIYQSRWTMCFKWSSVWSQSGLVCSRPLSMRRLMNKKVSTPVNGYQCEVCFNVWSRPSIFSVDILKLNYWNFRDWHYISLNYYDAPSSALVSKGKNSAGSQFHIAK